MSTDAQNVINSFNALPQEAQYEAARTILRATSDWDFEPLSEDALTQAADELFQELDRREANDGR